MTNPIANDPATEWHPAAPVPGHPEGGIRPVLYRPKPERIIERFWHVVVAVHLWQAGKLHSHDVMAESGDVSQIRSAPAANADPGHIELCVWRKLLRGARKSSRKNVEQCRAGAGAVKKLPSVDRV